MCFNLLVLTVSLVESTLKILWERAVKSTSNIYRDLISPCSFRIICQLPHNSRVKIWNNALHSTAIHLYIYLYTGCLLKSQVNVCIHGFTPFRQAYKGWCRNVHRLSFIHFIIFSVDGVRAAHACKGACKCMYVHVQRRHTGAAGRPSTGLSDLYAIINTLTQSQLHAVYTPAHSRSPLSTSLTDKFHDYSFLVTSP